MSAPKAQALKLWRNGFERHRRGDLRAAVDLYRRSISTCPTGEAHTFLGWAYAHAGFVERAIAECKRAIEVDPNFGNPYNDIGAYLIEKAHWTTPCPGSNAPSAHRAMSRATSPT